MNIPNRTDERKSVRRNGNSRDAEVVPINRRGKFRIWGGEGNRNKAAIDFAALLFDTLGYTPDEFVSIGHKIGGGPFLTEVCVPGDAPARVAALPDRADIYFGVNPITGPARIGAGRGTAKDVTRLAALWADLDVKSGACPNLEVARTIIDDLSRILGPGRQR